MEVHSFCAGSIGCNRQPQERSREDTGRGISRYLRAPVSALFLITGGTDFTSAEPNPLIGAWTSTINWDSPSGAYLTLQILGDGHLRETYRNHQGMGYTLFGEYKFDPARGILQLRWNDYEPKQVCAAVGVRNCSPLPPPQVLGVEIDTQIQFQNQNFFAAFDRTGQGLQWLRAK
jgi:hypothetical protein